MTTPMQPPQALDPVTAPVGFDTTVPATQLITLVPALKRELAVPGEFPTTFPNTQDSDLAGSLADSFAQAQLDGFFSKQVVDPVALTVNPGLSSGGGALIIIYASERMIRSQLRALKTTVKYEAAGVIYETQQSANVLTEQLKEFSVRRLRLLSLILRQARSARAVYVTDGYLTRSQGYYPLNYYGEFGSFYGSELLGFAPGALLGGY
jgi:hypothetical protein